LRAATWPAAATPIARRDVARGGHTYCAP